MKQHLIFGLIVLLLLILVPLASLIPGNATADEPQQPTTTQMQQQAAPQESERSISVMRTGTGEVEVLTMAEYLVGVVAAEMPAQFHEQALKAQAVAAHTFTRYRLEVGGAAHISDSPDSDQAYLCPQQRRERWGNNFEHYEARMQNVVRAVYGQTLLHGGRPIFAAYHAISGGTTECAQTYWGGHMRSYLRPVDSPGDRLAPNFNVTTSFSADEMRAAMARFSEVALNGSPAGWFGEPTRSEAGTVLQIEVGGARLTGRQVRQALGLRSSNFEIDFSDDAFRLTTAGFGHGVGMSQTGADFMARQGSTYREILAHFYPGAEIG